jgi:hypothetical protein
VGGGRGGGGAASLRQCEGTAAKSGKFGEKRDGGFVSGPVDTCLPHGASQLTGGAQRLNSCMLVGNTYVCWLVTHMVPIKLGRRHQPSGGLLSAAIHDT